MNWNAGYTKRKQKEMVKKAVESKTETKPLYPRIYTDSYLERRKTQHEHDKFCWRVGLGIITVMTGLFIWMLVEIV